MGVVCNAAAGSSTSAVEISLAFMVKKERGDAGVTHGSATCMKGLLFSLT